MSMLRRVALVVAVAVCCQLQAQAQEKPGLLRDLAMALLGPRVEGVSAVEVTFLGEPVGPWRETPAAFRVALFKRTTVANSTETRRELAAELSMTILADGVLGSMTTRAVSVEEKMSAFAAAYNANPNWTDAEAIHGLRTAGANPARRCRGVAARCFTGSHCRPMAWYDRDRRPAVRTTESGRRARCDEWPQAVTGGRMVARSDSSKGAERPGIPVRSRRRTVRRCHSRPCSRSVSRRGAPIRRSRRKRMGFPSLAHQAGC